ncbi:Response regulator receiver domain-containing protein [Marinospirillum celere]|uniref:Response regulator receiver domain-containing protein n=1 Tax=Marinospirillum celere TaxID=1122252 RepID=A0A1I1DW92_9GAMM|nr:response regulator [Marinospirillum celere]SFB79329.1 Response regulator receiver domain-containing protein [Marinospirillum celere]
MSKTSMHPEQGFRFRLLLVDDQPSNLHALGSLLSKDYDLVVATSGPQALKIAQGDQRPDLILLDVMMPDMDWPLKIPVLAYPKKTAATLSAFGTPELWSISSFQALQKLADKSGQNKELAGL